MPITIIRGAAPTVVKLSLEQALILEVKKQSGPKAPYAPLLLQTGLQDPFTVMTAILGSYRNPKTISLR